MSAKSQGIWISYLIGAPIGLFTIFSVFAFPAMLTGEGLATMMMIGVYGKAIFGLIFSFLVALGVGGYYATKCIEYKNNLIKASFKYSLIVNLIVWTVFILFTIAEDIDKGLWLYLLFLIITFIFCTAITTFTIGLLVCYEIKKKITKNNN